MALIRLSDRVIDLDALRVSGSSAARLTDLEGRVLSWLVEHPDRPVSRDELLVEAWGYQPGVRSRAPDTLIKQLRRKLELDPKDPVLLLSIYGEGYRWAGPGWAQPVDQLWPPRQDGFVGREELRTELASWLTSEHARVAVVGPPGSGGSRLIEEVIGTNAVVVRWIPGKEAAWLESEMEAQLGGDLDATAGQVIVLDDADADGLAAAAEVVLPRLRGGELRLCVSATSVPAWSDLRVLRVGPLTAEAALALLDQRVEQLGSEGPMGSDGVRRALVTTLAGSPGDIEAISRALMTASPEEVLAELRTDPDGLWRELLPSPSSRIEAAWRRLDGPARRFLHLASAWPAPVRRHHAVTATGLRPSTIRQLEQAGLIAAWRDAGGHSQLFVPGRVRTVLPAQPLERSKAARMALWEVLLDQLLGAARLSERELEDHAPLLLAAASDPSLAPDSAVDIVWTLFDVLDRAGTYRQIVRLLQHRKPVTVQARHRRDATLAAARVRLHQLDDAEAAGLRATESKEPLVQVRAWSSVGSARAIRGDAEAAIPAFEAASAIDIPPSSLRLQMVDNLAAVRLQMGDFDGGIEALEANVRDARSMGGGERLASILTNLTTARAAAGDAEGALRAGREALQLHQTLADPRMGAFDHANLAMVHSRTGESSTARDHADAAAALTPRFDDPRLSAWIDLAELLVRCAEGRGTDARVTLSAMLAGGGLARVAKGGGELLDALVSLATDPSAARERARSILENAPPLHGARLLIPSLAAALAQDAPTHP